MPITIPNHSDKAIPNQKLLGTKYESVETNRRKNSNALRDATSQFFVDILQSKCFRSIIKTVLWCMTLCFISLMASVIIAAWTGNTKANLMMSILNRYGFIYLLIIYYIFRVNKSVSLFDQPST